MKQNNPIITIPDPCHENWDEMTPVQQGRHCAMCQKTVIDFTLMSDGQILEVIKKANGRIPCGRYLPSQLDRPLIDNRPSSGPIGYIIKRIAAMVLMVQSVTTSMAQQSKKHLVTVEQYEEYDKDAQGRIQVSGKLIDSLSKTPVPQMSVYIKQIDTTLFTDANGLFSFAMPADLDTVTVLLNRKQFPDNTVHVALPGASLIPEMIVPVHKTKSGGEMVVAMPQITYQLIYTEMPQVMGASIGPQTITTVDWLKAVRFTICYQLPKAKPILKLRGKEPVAQSEKTVWGRLTNYWMGKKNGGK